MILATFYKNGKEYIYLLDGNRIEYAYKVGGSIYRDLSLEERALMDKVYSSIMASTTNKDYQKCGTFTYKGKQFQLMFDRVSRRKFFYEIVEGSYRLPAYEDFVFLNNKLNPESSSKTSYHNQKRTISEKNFRRMVSLGLSITINITAFFYGFVLGFESEKNIFDSDSRPSFSSLISSIGDKTIEDLEEALMSNPNLSLGEKEFILSNFDVLEENIDYVDTGMVYDRLQNLSIIYEKKESPYSGRYNIHNTITIHAEGSFESTEKYASGTLRHEVFHAFTSKFDNTGNKIYEALNEIFNCEYGRKKSGSYVLERKAVYLLIELLGVETMKTYYFQDDHRILVNSLMAIIKDEEKAYELIDLIDNLKEKYDARNVDCITIRDEERLLEELFAPINSLINEYFTAKYGYDMMQDEIMKNYVLAQGLWPEFPEIYSQLEEASSSLDMTNVKYKRFEDDPTLIYFSSEHFNEKYPDGVPRQIFSLVYVGDDGVVEEFFHYVEAPLREHQNHIADKQHKLRFLRMECPVRSS